MTDAFGVLETEEIDGVKHLTFNYVNSHILFRLTVSLLEIKNFVNSCKGITRLMSLRVGSFGNCSVTLNVNAHWMQFMVDGEEEKDLGISFGIWIDLKHVDLFLEKLDEEIARIRVEP